MRRDPLLLDCDNTLLDNDLVQDDLRETLGVSPPPSSRRRRGGDLLGDHRWPRGMSSFLCRIACTMVLASAAFAQSGCSIINHLVPSDQRDIYKFRPSFTVEDPQFRRSLDSVGSVMVGGNSAELLENGDGVFPPMIKDIREAKVSVNLETYIFKPDEAGRQFADAMIEAARRGVQVRLLIDAHGGKLGNLQKDLAGC